MQIESLCWNLASALRRANSETRATASAMLAPFLGGGGTTVTATSTATNTRTTTRRRRRGAINVWEPDRKARQVPTFVREMTGLKTKKAIVAKFGPVVRFVRGKPVPSPLTTKQRQNLHPPAQAAA